jgi:hypothetical protein
MPHFHLARWQWREGVGGPLGWRPPFDGAAAALDLRAHDECAIAAGTGGWGVFLYPTDIGDGSTIFTLTDDPQGRLNATARGAIETAIWNNLRGGAAQRSFSGILNEVFLAPDNVDVTGATKRKPLMPTYSKRIELHLGEKISDAETGPEDVNWPVIRAMYRQDLRVLLSEVSQGRLPVTKARMFLGGLMQRFGVSDPSEFQTPGDEQIEPLDPATPIFESFVQTDSSTLGPLLTWTEVAGSWRTVSDKAGKDSGGFNNAHSARAESALASADHYAQFVCTFGGTTYQGPAIRFAAGATTFYRIITSVTDATSYLSKIVAGVLTDINGIANDGQTSGDIHRLEIIGSSINFLINGVSKGINSDTTITANLYTGLNQAGDADSTINAFVADKIPNNVNGGWGRRLALQRNRLVRL